MTQYLIVNTATREVVGGRGRADEEGFIGPATPPPEAAQGTELIAWQQRLNFSAQAGVMKWLEGATEPSWEWPLADEIATNVLEVDVVADLARASVVGDPVRVKEYERAQQHAEAYRDSTWTLQPVPSSVQCWAQAKGWTAQEAAEDILAASARWYGALDYIRSLRLMAKEDIKRATSNSQADTILATFKSTLTAAMAGVV